MELPAPVAPPVPQPPRDTGSAPRREPVPAESAREHPTVALAPAEPGTPPERPASTREPDRNRRTGGRRRAPSRRAAVLPRIAAIVAVVIAIAGGGVVAYLISQNVAHSPPTDDAIPANSPTVAPRAGDSDVVDVTGFRGIRFGDKLTTLRESGRVVDVTTSPCGKRYHIAGAEGLVTLEFRQDGLAVLRVRKPVVHTPEGIAIGDSMTVVSQTYPEADELARSGAAASQAPGLLVEREQSRSYLFVGKETVTDIIIGDTDIVRGVYRAGNTGC